MEGLEEKVANIEKRLNELADIIKASLPRGRRQSVGTTRRPRWVEQIFKYFGDFSTEIDAIKKQLSTPADRAHSQSNTLGTHFRATTDAEVVLQNHASVRIQPERASPALPGCQQRRPSATDASEHTIRPDQSVTAPVFKCDFKDVTGELNEAKFEMFYSHPVASERGYFKLLVDNLPSLSVEEDSTSQPGEGHCTNFSCRTDSQGFVQISKGPDREVIFPSFPLPGTTEQIWSYGAMKDFWEKVLKDPPQDMPYIVGDPLFPDIELGPGRWLKKRGNLPGINTTYAYLSSGISGSIIHGEDGEFSSINLLRSGAHKFWLIVKPAHKKRLEDHMRRLFPMATCSQAVRHLSRLISPSKLDEWRIPYSLDYCKPGEAIVTMPRALHQVMNENANYAISTNIFCSASLALPKGYIFCQRNCDPDAITEADLQVQEQLPLAEVQVNKVICPPPRKHTRIPIPTENQLHEPTAVQPQTTGAKRKALPIQSRPKKRKVIPEVDSLFDAVCGKEAFQRLCSLIFSWRDSSKPLFEANKRTTPAHLVQVIGSLERRTQLAEFLSRFAKVKLVEIIDKGKHGRMRADPEAITNLIKGLKWEDSRTIRNKLHRYLKDGRRWQRIIGNFEGLLCLIPPGQISLDHEDKEKSQVSGRMYLELSDENIKVFHTLLDSSEFIQPMCQIGNTFQESIWSNAEVPEFKWESEDRKRISRLPIAKLTPFMEEFLVISANEWDVKKYDWPKPDCWTWDWPKNPSWIPPSDTQCDLCNGGKCDCITRCLPKNKPRITNEGDKGQGLRVIGIPYAKGQIISLYLGEFAPLDTYHDGWAMEFCRPDLGGEPVAQIYSREMGNYARKVNHSCNPSAKFCEKRISGQWQVVLIAIQDIQHNSEITVNCGKKFLSAQGKGCLCSECI